MIERRNEVEYPTEAFYDLLREALRREHPEASEHLLDHVISLIALLDKSILSGVSFGIEKAKLAAIEGELLGDVVGR